MRVRYEGALAAAIGFAVIASCSPSVEVASGPDVVHDTIGDTIVVRTLSGSAWGGTAKLEAELSIGELDGAEEYLFGDLQSLAVADDGTIYALDDQALHIRAYDADGAFLRSMGGPGEGPGEMSRPEAIALLPDGRIVVRDPGNQRVQVYSTEGRPDADWGVISGAVFSSTPIWADRDSRTYVFGRAPFAAVGAFEYALFVVESDGTVTDTLELPGSDYERPMVEVVSQGGRGRANFTLPFGADRHWSMAPDGSPILGIATQYRIEVFGADRTLRIERVYEPVAVQAAEREWFEDRIRSSARRMDPGWSWSGPRTPEHKPPFRQVWVGRDGSIWTSLSTGGVEVENASYDPDDPASRPTRWTEPYLLDAFANDGTYLGMLDPPDDMSLSPRPVFSRDRIWAVTRDELGVQRIVRYRIVAPGGAG